MATVPAFASTGSTTAVQAIPEPRGAWTPAVRRVAVDTTKARSLLRDTIKAEGRTAAFIPHVQDTGELTELVALHVGRLLLSKLGLDGIAHMVSDVGQGTFRSGPELGSRDVEVLEGEPLRVASPDDVDHRRRVEAATTDAVERGDRSAAAILSQPEMLTGEAFGKLLNASRDTINRWKRDGRLFALQGAKRGVRYPDWQVADGQLIPGMDRIVRAAKDRPWTAYLILTEPQPELGSRTGLDMVKRGHVDTVVSLIENAGELSC